MTRLSSSLKDYRFSDDVVGHGMIAVMLIFATIGDLGVASIAAFFGAVALAGPPVGPAPIWFHAFCWTSFVVALTAPAIVWLTPGRRTSLWRLAVALAPIAVAVIVARTT